MKNFVRTVLTVTAALVILLSANLAAEEKTAIPPTQALPDRLGMLGSKEQFLDWIVTNRPIYYSVFLSATKYNGDTITWLIPGTEQTFTSYAQFRARMATDGFRLYKDYFEPEKDEIATQIKAYCSLIAETPKGSVTSILFYRDIGTAYDITTNSFLECPYRYVMAPLLISGLESFEVKVNKGASYSYKWSIDGQQKKTVDQTAAPRPPAEFTTNGVVVFNDWYSTGAQYTTFEVKANGKTRKYTAFGDAFDSARLSLPYRGHIEAQVPKGADCIVQQSSDMTTWSDMPETYTSWQAKTQHTSYNVSSPTNCASTFYRVRVMD